MQNFGLSIMNYVIGLSSSLMMSCINILKLVFMLRNMIARKLKVEELNVVNWIEAFIADKKLNISIYSDIRHMEGYKKDDASLKTNVMIYFYGLCFIALFIMFCMFYVIFMLVSSLSAVIGSILLIAFTIITMTSILVTLNSKKTIKDGSPELSDLKTEQHG